MTEKTPPQGETPEQHVHESLSRQESAAKTVELTALKVEMDTLSTAASLEKETEKKAQEVERKTLDRAEALAVATDALASRVSTLADAVQINNYKIDKFQTELNEKPDDQELKFVTGMADVERRRHFKWAVVTAILTATLSGLAFYAAADRQSYSRCMDNAAQTRNLVSLLSQYDMTSTNEGIQAAITSLNKNKVVCA